MKNNSAVVLKFACLMIVATLNITANAEQMTAEELADWATQANQITRTNLSQPYNPSPKQQYSPQYSAQNARNPQNPFRNASFQPVTPTYGQAPTGSKERYPVGPPTLQCVMDAANRQNVPLGLLLAVNSIERGSTGQAVGNTNGTQDLGAFQINTIHLPRLATFQATRQDIASRGCYNAEFAALLLSEALNHPKMQHLDFYTRAAGYHSWTPQHNSVYRAKLIKYHKEWKAWLSSQNLQALVSTTTVSL